MGMLYRPENPKYGAAGSDRICRKEGEKASGRLCLEAPEDAVFYGASCAVKKAVDLVFSVLSG